ncbi:MAG: DUF3106 domain-containing protein [Bryobacteraceae bacterium]
MASFRTIPLLAIFLLVPGLIVAQSKKPNTLHPPRARLNAVDRLSRMTPEQRQRALAKLSPERRAILEDRLERYNQLPAAQKERLRAQTETFQSMPPERQEAVRKTFRQFNNLPDDRRKPVQQELRRLRSMAEPERSERMNSEAFHNRYSPDERQILENLAALVPPE